MPAAIEWFFSNGVGQNITAAVLTAAFGVLYHQLVLVKLHNRRADGVLKTVEAYLEDHEAFVVGKLSQLIDAKLGVTIPTTQDIEVK